MTNVLNKKTFSDGVLFLIEFSKQNYLVGFYNFYGDVVSKEYFSNYNIAKTCFNIRASSPRPWLKPKINYELV